MSATNRINITDGPPAHKIWDHAKYSQDPNVQIPLAFKSDVHEKLPGEDIPPMMLRITQVGHEDGSGQSLMINGFYEGHSFEGYFDARNRKGWVEVN